MYSRLIPRSRVACFGLRIPHVSINCNGAPDMTTTSKRKPVFILILFLLIGAGLAFLMFRPIPAPQSEQTIQIENKDVFK